jgi:hypothetical protein
MLVDLGNLLAASSIAKPVSKRMNFLPGAVPEASSEAIPLALQL